MQNPTSLEIVDPDLLARRALAGLDRYDEVWDGIVIMTPMPNNSHQELVGRLTQVLGEVISDADRGVVLPGANVSDRVEDWQSNYRIPDVAVFLTNTAAIDHDTFWHGGPDFVIEILSVDDPIRDKLPFYGLVGTQELLIINRNPWRLELYRLKDRRLELVQTADPDDGQHVGSAVTGLQPSLAAHTGRPKLLIEQPLTGRTWTI